MSGASVPSKSSQRLSKDGSTDGAPAQSAHLVEQLSQQKNTVRPADDKEENRGPSVVPALGISNSGLPQKPEPHAHESTSNDSPEGALAAEGEKVQEKQPSQSELVNVLNVLKEVLDVLKDSTIASKEMLDVLKDSTIASKSGKDARSRFWAAYKRVAEEHDDEFLDQYYNDMDIVLVFSGLFSAVSAAFIVSMESNLIPDPTDTTNALITQLVLIGLGNFTAAGSAPVAPASTWSPTTANLRVQSIAYASLSFGLLAAFGAMLCKQWLGYYKSHRYSRGSEDERGKRRQEKLDGIITWHFHGVVQSFPILLQISLLLFGIALGANMWYEQYTIAWVIIAATVFGFLFYSLTVMAALVSPACPFQTPISMILRKWRVDEVLRPMFFLASQYLQQLVKLIHGVLQPGLDVLHYLFYRDPDGHYVICRIRVSELTDSVFATCSFAWRCLQLLFGSFQRLLFWRRSPSQVVDPEAQSPDQERNIVATLNLNLPDTATSGSELPSINWLLETSTDPEVIHAAASLVPYVDWPLDLDVSATLRQLYNVYTTCLDVQERIILSLEEKASACTMALCHLYCNRILQGHPAYGFLGERISDYDVFLQMLERTKVNQIVLVATTKLFLAKYEPSFRWSRKFETCPDSVLDWLSHFLPFHFATGQVDEDVEKIAMEVISKLLCSSPSPQIIANCTLLACVMVGVRFDKKDIVRIDKSSALPRLAECLWTKFQEALRASDGGDLDSTVRRAWHFDVICRVLNRHSLSPLKTWNLSVICKIHSRARSSQHNDQDSLAALRKVQRFGFAVDVDQFPLAPADSAAPAWLWQHHFSWQTNSHSPEDFDWLVDHLGDVCSDDHETAGDILILLSSMRVGCSPAKQRLYVESLIACMDGRRPPRLRHAALRVAHSSRDVLASIDVIDDADMILTKFSAAILTAVCPQPGATPTGDGPDCFFHLNRDMCYLQLIFALARNSYWRPHLYCHMDRAIKMIAVCCESHEPHAFYLVGIFLRITHKQVSATSLSSITEQQGWNMMRKAWRLAFLTIGNIHCVEFLPDLVEGTKKYMRTSVVSKYDLKQLITYVNHLIRMLEHREGVALTMKELRGIADDILAQSG